MKSFTKTIIAGMILFSSASAQTFTHEGTTELGGGITYATVKSGVDGSSESIFALSPYIGFMVASGFELGFRPAVTVEEDETDFAFYFAPAFNINTNSNVYPYLEFLAGYNAVGSGGASNGGLGFGADGGLKVAVGPSSLLLIKFEYIHNSFGSNNTSLLDDTGFTLNTITFGVGFRVFFGRFGNENSQVKGSNSK